MSTYLLQTVETYRVDTDNEATEMINEAKADSSYTLAKFSRVQKTTKKKGEIVDEYYKVSLTKTFNSEKEPSAFGKATVSYSYSSPDDEDYDYEEVDEGDFDGSKN